MPARWSPWRASQTAATNECANEGAGDQRSGPAHRAAPTAGYGRSTWAWSESTERGDTEAIAGQLGDDGELLVGGLARRAARRVDPQVDAGRGDRDPGDADHGAAEAPVPGVVGGGL